MDNDNKNSDEPIMKALMIGLLLFVFTAFNNSNYSHCQKSIDYTIAITAISDASSNAILTTPIHLPGFNETWITSDSSCLKYKTNNDFFIFIPNRRIKTEYNFYTKRYLRIKPLRFDISTSFMYSSYPYEEYPAIA